MAIPPTWYLDFHPTSIKEPYCTYTLYFGFIFCMICTNQMRVYFLFKIALAVATSVLVGNDENFRELVLDSTKITLVDFYADWCRHCLKLMPTIESLSDAFASAENIQIVKVNGDKGGRKVARKFNIQGYPTLMLFKKGGDPIVYEGLRDQLSIMNFIQLSSGVRLADIASSPLPQKFSKITRINDNNLTEFTESQVVAYALLQHTSQFTEELLDLWSQASDEFHKDGMVSARFFELVISQKSLEFGSSFNITHLPAIMMFDQSNRLCAVFDRDFSLNLIVQFLQRCDAMLQARGTGVDGWLGRIYSLEKKLEFVCEEEGKALLRKILALEQAERDDHTDYTHDFIEDDMSMLFYYKKLIQKILDHGEALLEVELNRLEEMLDKDRQLMAAKSIIFATKRINVLKAVLSRRRIQ